MSENDIDICFIRLTADQLARTFIGDVRITPSETQIAYAQHILDRTGTLFRLVAGFRIEEWEKKK